MFKSIGACSSLGSPLSDPSGPQVLLSRYDELLSPHHLSIENFNGQLTRAVCQCLKQHKKPFVVGGDHSIAAGTWVGVSNHYQKPIGLLWVDAHLDGHSYDTSPTKSYHGMPLGYLLGHGSFSMNSEKKLFPIDPCNVCIIGARSFEREEKLFLEKAGVTIFYDDDIDDFSKVLQQAKKVVTKGTVGYGISFDFDVLSPVIAPGVSTPVAGGINVSQAVDLFALFNSPLAYEFVEYHPQNDRSGRTRQIAHQLFDFIGFDYRADEAKAFSISSTT